MALTKQDLIDSLTKMGVQLSGGETVKELKALIEANAEHLDEAPEGDIPEPQEVEEEGDDKGHVSVKYRDHVGQVAVRVFSKADHGKDFKKLAAEFKEKHAARLVA